MKVLIALTAVLSIIAACNAGYLRSYYPVHDYVAPVHVHHVQPVVVAPRSFSYGWDHSYISQPVPVVKVVKVHSYPSYSYGGWWDKKK